jgi:hypothetical protein
MEWGTTEIENDPSPADVQQTPVEEEPEPAPPAEHDALDAVEAHAEPEDEPHPVETPAEPVTEPQAVEVMLTELHEALAAEVGYAQELAPELEPRTVSVAFAPTTDGYRLFALEGQPEAGETIDIPEVGEYLVLRVGSSPIPGDDRRCAYVEERVTPALVAAAAH